MTAFSEKCTLSFKTRQEQQNDIPYRCHPQLLLLLRLLRRCPLHTFFRKQYIRNKRHKTQQARNAYGRKITLVELPSAQSFVAAMMKVVALASWEAAALMSCVQLLADAKANIAKFKATRRNITTEETEAINTSFMSEAHRVIYVSKARWSKRKDTKRHILRSRCWR